MDELKKILLELWIQFKLSSWVVKLILIITALVTLPIGLLIGVCKGLLELIKLPFKRLKK